MVNGAERLAAKVRHPVTRPELSASGSMRCRRTPASELSARVGAADAIADGDFRIV